MPLLINSLILLIFLFVPPLTIEATALILTAGLHQNMDVFMAIACLEMLVWILLLLFWLKKRDILPPTIKVKWKWHYLLYFVIAYFLHQFTTNIRMDYARFMNFSSRNAILFRPVIAQGSTFLTELFLFVATVILGPIQEELTFRAYLMNTWFKHHKLFLDVFLSAFLFACAHFMVSYQDPYNFMIFFITGLFLAIVYRVTKKLGLAIALHGFMNGINFIKPIWIYIYNYFYHLIRY